MALIKCAECAKEISSKAKACPHCGAKPPYFPGLGIFLVFIVVLLFGLKSISQSTDVSAPSPADPSASARGACILFIKRKLHDPGSAEFEHSETARVSQNGSQWTVQRAVRAKNAFNATRKSVFECVMRDEGDSWTAISVKELR